MADEAPGVSIASNVDQAAVERIVIKNADLSIVVDDPAAAMKTIVDMAESRVALWSTPTSTKPIRIMALKYQQRTSPFAFPPKPDQRPRDDQIAGQKWRD